ncbi:MAG: hypothetical protein J0H34_20685 [Rhizobiales bacterium]|nr:hypothetical protein [Hyphomicrobiales bacterium]
MARREAIAPPALAPSDDDLVGGRASRVRASERAITAALKAMRAAGLSVQKLCVTGAQVEIHAGSVEAVPDGKNDDGLEEW